MLTRRSGERFTANIWPGFVDAMTAILLILMFILSIFMIIQSILRDTISVQEIELSEQEVELSELGNDLKSLSDQLGLLRSEKTSLEASFSQQSNELKSREKELNQKISLLLELRKEMDIATKEIKDFELQVASLITKRLELSNQLKTEKDNLSSEVSKKEAAELALARARKQINKKIKEEKIMAATNEALELLIKKLKYENQIQLSEKKDILGKLETSEIALSESRERLDKVSKDLTDAEKRRLLEQFAIKNLKESLATNKEELAILTLALEEERKNAMETLKLLAASREAKALLEKRSERLEKRLVDNETIMQTRDLALREARLRLSAEEEKTKASREEVARLTLQASGLSEKLDQLTSILDETIKKDYSNNVEIQALGAKLNAALAKVASEQRVRAQLEEKERKRLESEAKNLREYRSEFFGRLKKILGEVEGIDVVGDRFVFSSEVLFDKGSADLGFKGQEQLDQISRVLKDISLIIPEDINWILRVDGHTDITPVSESSNFGDNWELSQARSLSVVRYMIKSQDIDPKRLSAAGFGEHQPISFSDSNDALAKNRRIEFKLTER
jgi:chemotaxis protein MotB